MAGTLFSPGKLLLTSEYVVLDGALALAVPTKWGQEFFFEENRDGNSMVFWEAYHQNSLWLSAEIDYKTWKFAATTLPQAAAFVLKVLQNVQKLSGDKFRYGDSGKWYIIAEANKILNPFKELEMGTLIRIPTYGS